MMNKIMLAAALVFGLASPSLAQTCPGCIQNSASTQTAQINIGTATIRGTLTASTGTFIFVNSTWANFTTLVASTLAGSGSSVTNLNASQLLSGTVAAARLAGAYTGITSVGTLAAGIWNGTIIGTQYGGTGNNWAAKTIGNIPYFSTTGAMNTLAPGDAGKLLQTNGGAAPSWTGAPSILGTNITSIPLANLQTGALPTAITVADASLTSISASKVTGNISGGASTLTTPLPIGNLASGTLPTSNAASSITVTGVTPGTYGGPTQIPQFHVSGDGRIDSASQSSLSVPVTSISTGPLPSGITIAAPYITTGTIPSYAPASSITATGVSAGSYGDATRTVTLAVRSDGRLGTASHQLIAINPSQINAGALPGNITVPAASVSAGTLASDVTATKVANSGVTAGTYGGLIQIPQLTVGADGRVTSATQFIFPALSTSTVASNLDNNWSHAQTSQSSWTIHADLFANNISAGSSVTASGFFGNGSALTGLACARGAGSSSVLCQGTGNLAAGTNSTLSGGNSNSASAANSTVGGGSDNTASGSQSTIGGGGSNIASGSGSTGPSNMAATVAGGFINTASGDQSTVGGGFNNIASGDKATIPGGSNNIASGMHSFAAGKRAEATKSGSFVWADAGSDNNFTTTIVDSFIVRAPGGFGIGTASPAAQLDVNGAIKSNSSVTAATFVGNGSALTGIPSTSSIVGVYAPLSGATFTGASGITNSAFTATGPSGNLISAASVTASGFFGDGTGLTNVSDTSKLPLAGGTMTGQLTNTSSITVANAAGAGFKALFTPDGSNLLLNPGLLTIQNFAATPSLHLSRVNGTQTSSTTIVSGNVIGVINFRGYTGINATTNLATIGVYAEDAFSTTSAATNMAFTTQRMNVAPNTTLRAFMIGTSTGPVFVGNYSALQTGLADGTVAQLNILPSPGFEALLSTGSFHTTSSMTASGFFGSSINLGANQWYYCSGSTAGTFDGNLARGNGNAGACAGGTWIAVNYTSN